MLAIKIAHQLFWKLILKLNKLLLLGQQYSFTLYEKSFIETKYNPLIFHNIILYLIELEMVGVDLMEGPHAADIKLGIVLLDPKMCLERIRSEVFKNTSIAMPEKYCFVTKEG